jgi:hypothetical protein
VRRPNDRYQYVTFGLWGERVVKALLRAVTVLLLFAPGVMAQTSQVPSANFPANLRWELVPEWIAWETDKATISWPPNDGCAGKPHTETLAAGTLIDRFGSEGGSFFSPQGEGFAARAVPYECRQKDYRVYRVVKPLSVRTCKAAPWFGDPGGAVQEQTAEPAYNTRGLNH